MLSIDGVLGLLNDKNRTEIPFLYKWRSVYYGMSLHIDGIRPLYYATLEGGRSIPIYRTNMGYYDWYYQFLFDDYLFNKYPNEPAKTRNWRYSNYRPFTQDPFQRCISTVMGAIFQDSGYQVTIDDKEDNDYIWGENFEGKSLVAYFENKFQNICNDPNALFITIPKEPRYAMTTAEVQPKIYFIPSRTIIHIGKDEIVFEASDYTWWVNNIGYFRFLKTDEGKYIHVDEAQGGYYAHLLGRTPHMVAGGVWNTQGYYESWLHAAKPIADEYISGMSDEQMVMKQASFPFIEIASTDCPSCNGERQLQWCTSCNTQSLNCNCGADHSGGSNLTLINCSKCGGSGNISINPGDLLVAPAEDMAHPLIRVTGTPVEINKLHIDRNEKIYHDLMRALHLNYIDEAQSGVAKDKDMETRYQFILKISNDFFDRLIKGAIKDIISLRHTTVRGNNTVPLTDGLDELFTIVKPTQFGIKTSDDLVEEYKLANESGLPVYQLNEILDDFVDKRFGGNNVLKRKTCLINQWDILANMKYADISIVLLNNGATDRDLQYHLQLPRIIDQLVYDYGNDWLLDTKDDVIKTEVDTLFKAIKPVIPEVQPEQIEETRINV